MLELCLYVLLAFRLLCGVPLLVRASVSSISDSASADGVGYGRTSTRDVLLWSSKMRPRENAWAYIRRGGSFPQLPDRSSPESASWKNSIAMCTSIRSENTTDVREWVLYHRWLGFDHIFLTENAKSASKELKAQLSDFIDSGFLTYSLEPTGANFKHCFIVSGQREVLCRVHVLCQGCQQCLSASCGRDRSLGVRCERVTIKYGELQHHGPMDVQKRLK